jgi:gliding motility-associated-like protein
VVTTTYYYHVANDIGCPNIDSMTITVIPAPPIADDTLAFDIKNVITANGDGFNDSWMIDGLEAFPGTFVVVFNTYGNEVFTSPDYQNDWKGTYKGGKLPNGTYFYSVIPGGTETKVSGSLTILGDE